MSEESSNSKKTSGETKSSGATFIAPANFNQGSHIFGGDHNTVNNMGNSNITTKEEFLSSLRSLKEQIKTIAVEELPENDANDTISKIEAVEKEVEKKSGKPELNRITSPLEKAKDILKVGATVAGAVSAITKITPLVEHLIKVAEKIF